MKKKEEKSDACEVFLTWNKIENDREMVRVRNWQIEK